MEHFPKMNSISAQTIAVSSLFIRINRLNNETQGIIEHNETRRNKQLTTSDIYDTRCNA